MTWWSMWSAPKDGREILARETKHPFRKKRVSFRDDKWINTGREGGILLPFYPDEWWNDGPFDGIFALSGGVPEALDITDENYHTRHCRIGRITLKEQA